MTRQTEPVVYRISEADSPVDVVLTWVRGDEPGTVRLVKVEVSVEEGSEISADDLRRIPLSLVRARVEDRLVEDDQEEEIRSLKISRPDGTRGWYIKFAAVFMYARTISTSPAKDIAEANGYKISAVHRWTANARKYRYLPPDVRSRS